MKINYESQNNFFLQNYILGLADTNPGYVHLADHAGVWLEVADAPREVDALALAAGVRLEDVRPVAAGARVRVQVTEVCREAPRLGEEVVVLGEQPEHPVEVSGQQILPADFGHSGEVIDFLQK